MICDLSHKYKTRVAPITHEKGWSSLKVEILDENDNVLGHYERNYHSLFDTFYPFTHKGKEYALYSKDYTATRVMTLPDCKDLCGEEPNAWGFCPVEFAAPDEAFLKKETENFNYYVGEDEKVDPDSIFCDFALVAGCIWGDDTSWKIQYLDLSELEKGVIKREPKFGYVELGGDLKDALDLSPWGPDNKLIKLKISKCYRLDPFESF